MDLCARSQGDGRRRPDFWFCVTLAGLQLGSRGTARTRGINVLCDAGAAGIAICYKLSAWFLGSSLTQGRAPARATPSGMGPSRPTHTCSNHGRSHPFIRHHHGRAEHLLSRHLQAQDLVFRCPPPCARASRQLTHHQRAQRDSSPPGHPMPCLTYSFVLCAAAGAPEVGAGGEGRASSSRSSVPPLRPGERRSHRGSASVALPRVSPRSALGTPLNLIQEALLRLLAGLLDLLKPEFG